MASTLPNTGSNCCAVDCSDVTTIQTPGPQGEEGDPGSNGTDGVNAFSTFTNAYTIPAELGSASAVVSSTEWMGLNQVLYAARVDGTVLAYLQVTAITDGTNCTLKNLEDAASSAYSVNSAPGSILIAGSTLSPAGVQGATGLLSGSAAGGDLKGTYPNPKILVANSLGQIPIGNGTDTTAFGPGTNGHIMSYDSSQVNGVRSGALIPLTGSTNASTNRIPRLSAATGLPIPLVASKAQINDAGSVTAGQIGAIVLDNTAGNPRGTDAVDLQVNRTNATEVASGTESVICGGDGNTASGARAVCVGGDANSVTSTEGFVGGGESNQAITGDRTVVCGGQSNTSSGTEAFVGGGQNNTATGNQSVVCGGDGNDATGDECVVGGGQSNTAGAVTQASILGGLENVASAGLTSIGGGRNNSATATSATIPGGSYAAATHYGEMAHASGQFASQGDAQTMEVLLRCDTTDATPTEMFLDGSQVNTLRLTIPSGASWIYKAMVVVRRSTGTTSIYDSVGQLQNVAGTTTSAAIATTELNDGIGLPPAPVVFAASDPLDALTITCTGIAANIRWLAWVRIVQVIYA